MDVEENSSEGEAEDDEPGVRLAWDEWDDEHAGVYIATVSE